MRLSRMVGEGMNRQAAIPCQWLLPLPKLGAKAKHTCRRCGAVGLHEDMVFLSQSWYCMDCNRENLLNKEPHDDDDSSET